MRKKLVIGHLFPELLNMYGDKGNVKCLENRLLWRDMEAEIRSFSVDDALDFSDIDILILGGGADKEQKTAFEKLSGVKESLASYVEAGGVLLALCGGYSMLGKTWVLFGEEIEGLSLLPIDSQKGTKRQIGDVIIRTNYTGEESLVVGFENHSDLTYVQEGKAFGTVVSGFGNNGEDASCGAVYKNLLGTYLHGPILPKNPALADSLLARALEKKYGEKVNLFPLDDRAEQEAHDYIVDKYAKI
ncbi:MAG: glutamine amidotransferase [Clostridia bacterium]|nr:glutamine amidotransferase [Clostridia bacterium]